MSWAEWLVACPTEGLAKKGQGRPEQSKSPLAIQPDLWLDIAFYMAYLKLHIIHGCSSLSLPCSGPGFQKLLRGRPPQGHPAKRKEDALWLV